MIFVLSSVCRMQYSSISAVKIWNCQKIVWNVSTCFNDNIMAWIYIIYPIVNVFSVSSSDSGSDSILTPVFHPVTTPVQRQDSEERYSMDQIPRGRCLILTYDKFINHKARQGNELDRSKLIQVCMCAWGCVCMCVGIYVCM